MSDKRPTLKDVAEHSGYALRTVKKVFSGTETVSETTRMAVLKAANELKYTRNRFASALAKNKRIKIAVIYAPITKAYFPDIERGFLKCEADCKDFGLNIEFFCTNNKDLRYQMDTLDEIAQRDDIDGIVIQPISSSQLNDKLDALVDSGIPIVTFGSDAPASKRMCYVGPDAYLAGRVAAQLMSNYIGKRGNVCIITQIINHMQTQQRMQGFTQYCAENCPDIHVRELNIPDDSTLYYDIVKNMLMQNDISGLFGTDAEIYLAGSVIKDLRKRGITVVGFDLGHETETLMKEDYIQIIIEQNPSDIAYKALSAMFNFLFDGTVPPAIYRTGITVITSECIE